MKQDQKLTPKYWVVHDKNTDDVYLNSAHKNKAEAETWFVKHLMLPCSHSGMSFEDAYELYLEDENYECILIEIKKVKM